LFCLRWGIGREVGGRICLRIDTDASKEEDEREGGGEHREGREKGMEEEKDQAREKGGRSQGIYDPNYVRFTRMARPGALLSGM
jgi:hypothetical protein